MHRSWQLHHQSQCSFQPQLPGPAALLSKLQPPPPPRDSSNPCVGAGHQTHRGLLPLMSASPVQVLASAAGLLMLLPITHIIKNDRSDPCTAHDCRVHLGLSPHNYVSKPCMGSWPPPPGLPKLFPLHQPRYPAAGFPPVAWRPSNGGGRRLTACTCSDNNFGLPPHHVIFKIFRYICKPGGSHKFAKTISFHTLPNCSPHYPKYLTGGGGAWTVSGLAPPPYPCSAPGPLPRQL